MICRIFRTGLRPNLDIPDIPGRDGQETKISNEESNDHT